MTHYKDVPIFIAGSSERIKNRFPPHWRFRIGDGDEQLMEAWTVDGVVTPENHGQGTNPKATRGEFLAWVWYQGDIEFDEATRRLTIHLRR